MKKLLSVLFFSLIFISVFARQIDEQTARTTAINFIRNKAKASVLKVNTSLSLAYKLASKGNKEDVYLYIFNVNKDKGFIIIAGDDVVLPVLGYSDESAFNAAKIPAPVAYFLEGYRNQVAYAIENKIAATDKIRNAWNELLTNVVPMNKKAGGAGPLLKTKWDQDPYYNDKCPYDYTYSTRTVTGCVATAMAQVMKFWNFPAKGSGFHSYSTTSYGTLSADFANTAYAWASMPTKVTTTDTNVAKLMYHCGVSVNMIYGVGAKGGSSAYVITSASPVTNCAEYALKTYFNYDKKLSGEERKNYTDSKWISTMETQIDSGWPVIYAGFGSGGGHCFVLDGYDANDLMHYNWGWSGLDNGYFQIDSLNPGSLGTGGGSGGFNSGQQAIINIRGIKPPVSTTANLNLDSDLTTNQFYYSYGRKIIANTHIVNSASSSFTGDLCAAIFDTSNNFIDYVQIKNNVTIASGGTYSAVFTDTPSYSILPGYYKVYSYYRVKNGNWQPLSGTFTANSTTINVSCYGYIALYADDSLVPKSFVQGKSASVYTNVINVTGVDFTGSLFMGLYDLTGKFVDSIQTLISPGKLPAGSSSTGYYHYKYDIKFSTPKINAKPGTYLLVLDYYFPGLAKNWYLGGTNWGHLNPIKVTVEAAPLNPDKYENDDTIATAYSLPLSWSSNLASANTAGSNIHVGTDQDYYKLILPKGFDYSIGANMKNSVTDSAAGYTIDAIFSYSTDAGTTWAGPYDNSLSGNISIKNGGTVYLWVSPRFTGTVGTYELDMSLSRGIASGIEDINSTQEVRIYPNPAHDYITLDFGNMPTEEGMIKLNDLAGREMYSAKVITAGNSARVPLEGLAKGIYILHLQMGSSVITRRITVN